MLFNDFLKILFIYLYVGLSRCIVLYISIQSDFKRLTSIVDLFALRNSSSYDHWKSSCKNLSSRSSIFCIDFVGTDDIKRHTKCQKLKCEYMKLFTITSIPFESNFMYRFNLYSAFNCVLRCFFTYLTPFYFCKNSFYIANLYYYLFIYLFSHKKSLNLYR